MTQVQFVILRRRMIALTSDSSNGECQASTVTILGKCFYITRYYECAIFYFAYRLVVHKNINQIIDVMILD